MENLIESFVIKTFCIIDEHLNAIKFRDDVQAKMTSSEIMTTAVVAGKLFGGNHENARKFLRGYNYIPNMLSKGQFNRRLHALEDVVWEGLMHKLGEVFKEIEKDGDYLHDSFPVPICANVRMKRCRMLNGSEYLGYSATKNDYFFGFRVHMTSTKFGGPVELKISPGSYHDSNINKDFDFDLPEGSILHGDNGCADQNYEKAIEEGANINVLFHRRANSKNPHHPWDDYMSRKIRKRTETTFSVIQGLFPKKIHAVKAKGFCLKIVCFIMAYSIGII